MSTTLAPLPMFNIAIEPPADIASIIDKTAYFVAKVGADFERRVFENEKNNPKFTFLKPSDSYHPYYQLRIRTYIEQQTKSGELVAPAISAVFQQQPQPQVVSEPQPPEIPSINSGEELVSVQQKKGFNYISERVVQTVRRSKTTPIPELPAEQFIMELPADISAMDLDIIRLTAQFVSKNGHQFQVGLLNREHKNPQFDFLKQNHPQHTFFLALVEAYTRCLNPPKNIAERLRSEYKDKTSVLDKLIMKYDSEKQVERARIEKEKVEKKQLESSNTVDWYDFVIVETIDFTDDDFRLPTMVPVFPTAPSEEPMQTDDVSMDVEEEEPKAKPAEFKVKKDYIKGQQASTISKALKFAVCPKCGQEVPVDEMEEHMRIELLDPRYRVQKQNILDRSRGVSIASNDEISKNLQQFARKRGDIFGKENELEAAEEPEEKKDDKVIWDGHTNSIPATINAAISSAIEQQIKSKEEKTNILPANPTPVAPPPGIVPKPPQASPIGAIRMAPPPGIYMPPPPQSAPKIPHPAPGDEPDAKRQRIEEGGFINEQDFIAKHGNGSITIKIQVPLDDKKSEWKLQGQTLSIQVNMKDTGAALKEKIKGLTGVPANKQKVKGPTFPIMRDDQTMAGYNLLNGSVLSLSLKERGGKNK